MKARIPSAPTVRIGRATLSIEVKDATAAAPDAADTSGSTTAITAVPTTRIQAALDAVFRESFTIVQSNGEAQLRVAIIHYTPADSAIRTLVQKVRLPLKKDGSATKEVEVEQWTAQGHIAVRAEVVDSAGVLVDGFAPQASVKGQAVVSVDGVDRLDRTQMPTSDAVLAKLVDDLVVQFRPRYCPPVTELEVPLAVDEELRAGNQFAKNGDLPAAVKSWEAAVLSRQPTAADRIHNIGAAYEVQAYDMLMRQGELNQIKPYLQRAAKQYSEAAALDPEEKYITRASERVRSAFALIEALDELEQKRQKTLASKTRPSPWPPKATAQAENGYPAGQSGSQDGAGQGTINWPKQGGTAENPDRQGGSSPAVLDPAAEEALAQALNDARPDTPQEKVFRQFVNMRLRAANGPVDDATRKQIESNGPLAYGLTALSSKRVVHQEAQAWAAAQPKIAAYRESFIAFGKDGGISPEERAVLDTLAKSLGLSEEDRKSVEGAVK